MKEIILLGATGSIGAQVLDVIKDNNEFRLVAISFGKNVNKAIEIIEEFKPQYVCTLEEKDALYLKEKFEDINFCYGNDGLVTIASLDVKKGLLVNAIVGIAGLLPTIKGIESKKDILLANKETLVVAGDIINRKVFENGVKLIPIDSEHSAILQCLNSGEISEVKKIIITASGGSFRDKTREELENVTLEEAIKHPNWSMGTKITIDSSTMVNKGLEIIEAHHLFGLSYDKIEAIIHKESIIHSMVEYNDGAIIAQLGTPNMRIPIAYALNYPHHKKVENVSYLDLIKNSNLTFQKMDYDRFPMVRLAYFVGKSGGILPLVYNTSNEVAVDLFIKGKIKYLEIEKIITDMVNFYKEKNILNPTVDDIFKVDKEIRELISSNVEVK